MGKRLRGAARTFCKHRSSINPTVYQDLLRHASSDNRGRSLLFTRYYQGWSPVRVGRSKNGSAWFWKRAKRGSKASKDPNRPGGLGTRAVSRGLLCGLRPLCLPHLVWRSLHLGFQHLRAARPRGQGHSVVPGARLKRHLQPQLGEADQGQVQQLRHLQYRRIRPPLLLGEGPPWSHRKLDPRAP